MPDMNAIKEALAENLAERMATDAALREEIAIAHYDFDDEEIIIGEAFQHLPKEKLAELRLDDENED